MSKSRKHGRLSRSRAIAVAEAYMSLRTGLPVQAVDARIDGAEPGCWTVKFEDNVLDSIIIVTVGPSGEVAILPGL